MANEWLPSDILRVMRKHANNEGLVDMSRVHRAFNVKTASAKSRWDKYLDYLIEDGLVTKNGGRYFVKQ